MWPVFAVVGENGAFYFRYDHAARTMQRRYIDDAPKRAAYRAQLEAVAKEILAAVPGAALAADQRYRETDLAIAYREDVAPLAPEAVERIGGLMRSPRLSAKVSSIHVNGWFGAYDKLTMTSTLIREVLGTGLDVARRSYVFVGDSPNDAPMFACFAHSVGVANIRDFAGRLDHEPAYVTAASNGAGFGEVADLLLAARDLV